MLLRNKCECEDKEEENHETRAGHCPWDETNQVVVWIVRHMVYCSGFTALSCETTGWEFRKWKDKKQSVPSFSVITC